MAESLKDALNRCDINTLADAFRILKLGTILRGMSTALRKSTVAASTFVDATCSVPAKQAADSPAARITGAYVRAGATPGPLAVVTTVPPLAGEISIAPNGQLLVLAADAITDMDVQYEPVIGEVLEFANLPATAANTVGLPPSVVARGAVILLEVEALTGTSTGDKIIEAAGAAPAAGGAALNAAKSAVAFNAADAVTSARVKLLVASSADVSALLAADSPIL